mmetsp:Transcript_14059/g.20570  ORF Transcript_14059/g.20570 Transcript_14059/m.20570 type:complete len:282 (+) Transcript_14059:70-915(+)
MVADSKDFVPNRQILLKVMQIIFEIASCPWKDDWKEQMPDDDTQTSHHSLTSPSTRLFIESKNSDLVLRCMLLRKKYGGMACDMGMIDDFVRLWGYRFLQRQLEIPLHPGIVTLRFPNLGGSSSLSFQQTAIYWDQVPSMVYARSSEQSLASVRPIVTQQLYSLRVHDITPSGIDFHCSNVLESLCTNASFNKKLLELQPRVNATKEGILETLKQCMWEYCSGVNHRRYFNEKSSVSSNDNGDQESYLRSFWKSEAEPTVNTFVRRYIATRMSNKLFADRM